MIILNKHKNVPTNRRKLIVKPLPLEQVEWTYI